MALKWLVARKGRASFTYSDNTKTFVVDSVISKTNKDEKMPECLIRKQIIWTFNLNKAPWWGGQVRKIIGLLKQSLFKPTWRAILNKQELEKTFIEDDIPMQVLTLNTFVVQANYNDSRREARWRYSRNKKTPKLYQQV